MVDWLTDQRDVTLQVAGQVQIAYRAHERIFKAVASRDLDVAERAMAAHLKQLHRVYERVRASMRAKPAIGHLNSVATRRLPPGAP
jgi:DNA-binding GntR family transcriptional regulator